MNREDKVLLVVGAWVSDTHKRWVFEPDHSFKGEHYISLYSGMSMSDLVRGVREEIDPTYEGVNLKLSYQYPEWISADGGALDMPQYITDDTEVGVFIELRRSIEAVNLLVSVISAKANEEGAASYINDTMAGRQGEREDAGIEGDEWHEFAMAENTVTIPNTKGCAAKTNLKILDTIPHEMSGIAYRRTPAIPFQIGGVEIRDPEQNIRQGIQPEPGVAIDKGKKKMRIETTANSDSDSDDDMVVPVFRTTADLRGKGKRPIGGTTAAGQSNTAAEGLDMVNDPHIPDLLDMEGPPQRTAHQISVMESEISDIHIQGGETFVGRGSKTNMNGNTSASTTLFLKHSGTSSSSIRRCIRCGVYGHNKATCRIPI
ncbi:hypothetical protein F2Q70_00042548 [Brassica cretica]|uniref:Uncharacterized protein n=1 Tax=Brassica cretica TaxID=69181 RepID=A0A8S9LRS0_BRACR|nr:hypothetical protein F2Q70_00042548 [Brassica cretica]KAF2608757.1 hypothetical protein F2Q68_00043344 [Brassica cretica]